MRCPQCNARNPASADRCAKCGASFAAGAPQKRAMHNRYTIQRSLGKGGMGTIYLASEIIAGRERQVVIKEMLDYYDPRDTQERAKARKRFEGEAATLVSLNVSGVPQIFDYFSEGERNYIVMQFVEGQNLETRLTHLDDNGDVVIGNNYPVEQARRWGMKLCKILEALSEQGILHLDIKPSNLILDKSGDIWLVDFGTAKVLRGGQAPIKPDPQKTGLQKLGLQKTSIYGTMGYAAPEQIGGKPETRSDVYALAATLYHLMTDDDPGDHPDDFPKLDQLPKHIATALRRALATGVKTRVGAAELRRLLGVQPGHSPVFHWRDGTITSEPSELTEMTEKNWGEALGYFRGDAWEKWFRDLYRNDLADKLKLVKSQDGAGSPGMDAFLRLLDPEYPLPVLELPIPSLDAGTLSWGETRCLDLEVLNQGGGCLKARFINLPPGIEVKPLEFVTHERKLIKVTVKSRLLTPELKVQTRYLTLDAGPAGKMQAPLKVNIPAPDLHVTTPSVDFGSIYPDEIRGEISLRNQGGSEFVGEVRSDAFWVAAHPGQFRCQPGGVRKLQVRVDARRLPFGQHTAQVAILARAGGWQQLEEIPVRLAVSFWKVFWKHWAPPIVWVIGWMIYGGLAGYLLGGLSAMMGAGQAEPTFSMLTGVLFAILICVLPGALVGLIGGIAGQAGRDGSRRGVYLGISVGAVAGFAGSYLALQALPIVGLEAAAAPGMQVFAALVGVAAGAIFGLVLWLLAPEGYYSF